ncbi:UNVERIFIED_CONTAM: hypothetical protein GTU68_025437 [Idotea baltica]|nr:hypothetical protein [Idotea baltica]
MPESNRFISSLPLNFISRIFIPETGLCVCVAITFYARNCSLVPLFDVDQGRGNEVVVAVSRPLIILSRRSRSRTRSPHSHSPSRSRSRSRSRSAKRHRSRSDDSRNGYDSQRRRSRSPMSSRRRHVGTRDDPSPSHCIGVFGLSVYTTERQLEEIFEKYGSIERVQVVLDAKTGKSRGFAFVYFEAVKSATNAKEDCTGMEIDGRRIRVDYSITQRPHTPTPGIYMGRPTTGGSGRRDYYDRGYVGWSQVPSRLLTPESSVWVQAKFNSSFVVKFNAEFNQV